MKEYEKILHSCSPDKLGYYAMNRLATGYAEFLAYGCEDEKEILTIRDAFRRVDEADLEEMVRYANHLAEKEGLGKEYFNPESAKKNRAEQEASYGSRLREKTSHNSAAAA